MAEVGVDQSQKHTGGAAELVAAARQETRKHDDEDFIKLVQQLAMMNPTVENFAEAIIEDVGYGAHRADRLFKSSAHERDGHDIKVVSRWIEDIENAERKTLLTNTELKAVGMQGVFSNVCATCVYGDGKQRY